MNTNYPSNNSINFATWRVPANFIDDAVMPVWLDILYPSPSDEHCTLYVIQNVLNTSLPMKFNGVEISGIRLFKDARSSTLASRANGVSSESGALSEKEPADASAKMLDYLKVWKHASEAPFAHVMGEEGDPYVVFSGIYFGMFPIADYFTKPFEVNIAASDQVAGGYMPLLPESKVSAGTVFEGPWDFVAVYLRSPIELSLQRFRSQLFK